MTEEQLNQLSIFALRELARQTGVESPTSKKKGQLISLILSIESGAIEPKMNRTKQGRPPKSIGYNFSNFASQDNTKQLVLKQDNNKVFNYKDLKTACGFLDIVSADSAYFWLKEDIAKTCYFVGQNVLEGQNFKQGDKVVAQLNIRNNQRVVENIFSVNDCPISKFNNDRQDYSSLQHKMPSKLINFASKEYKKFEIKIGESVYFYGSNSNSNSLTLAQMANVVMDMKKIYINVSLAEKNIWLKDNFEQTENFTSDLMESSKVAQRVVRLAVEHAKRLMEKGENVLVLVDDFQSVLANDDEENTISKSLITLTKNAGTKGSITLFAIIPSQNIMWIEKLCDKRIMVTDK